MTAQNRGLGYAPDTPGRLNRLLDRIRGRPVEHDLRPYLRELERIEGVEPGFRSASDGQLRKRSAELREAVTQYRDSDAVLPVAFALVRASASRVLDMRPFDSRSWAASRCTATS
jgi:preprotein translocase subunit SecA